MSLGPLKSPQIPFGTPWDPPPPRVVAADPKGRFALRPDPLRVRANQGHSLPVPELELTPLLTPGALPPTLAHGTRRRLWGAIRHLHLAGGLPGDPGVRSGMRSDSEIAIIIDGPRALAGEGRIPIFGEFPIFWGGPRCLGVPPDVGVTPPTPPPQTGSPFSARPTG
uniref:tRNA phosphotransferase 1 n=1 Tax=Catharus ustulatus TaxID=91951 RepID=A0A8C3V398_CATUS